MCGPDGQQWQSDEPGGEAAEYGSDQQRAGGEAVLRPPASVQ